ncbi:MAG: uroporphyrinogen decarboxylase family protein [Oscillospiraceae bacterium]|nr:uroporphyrinogen decarboxylase family protein [Oscillospiraceae bacterium]
MKYDMYQWTADIIESDTRLAMPILTFPAVQIAKIPVFQAVKDGQKQYELMKIIADRYDMIASLTNMDLSVEAEAFGATVRFANDETPTVTGMLIEDIENVPDLQIPQVGAARTAESLKAVELAVDNIKGRPVLASCIGPFSLAGRLLDMNEIMLQLRMEPELTHALLEKCTQFLIEYVRAFKLRGANGVVMAEPAAGLLSPQQCDEFSSAYVKQIVSSVQDESFIIVLHNCGNTLMQVRSLASTGAKCLHFGNAVNMKDIMPQVPEDIIAMGNINPTACFLNGTPENVAEATNQLLNDMKNYKNFVVSTGCDLPPNTPFDNIDAFFMELSLHNHR